MYEKFIKSWGTAGNAGYVKIQTTGLELLVNDAGTGYFWRIIRGGKDGSKPTIDIEEVLERKTVETRSGNVEEELQKVAE